MKRDMTPLLALNSKDWLEIALAGQDEEQIEDIKTHHQGWGLRRHSSTLREAVGRFCAAITKLQMEPCTEEETSTLLNEFEILINDFINYASRVQGVDFLLTIIYFFTPKALFFNAEKGKKHLSKYLVGVSRDGLAWLGRLSLETVSNMAEIIFDVYEYLVIKFNTKLYLGLPPETTPFMNAYDAFKIFG